MGRVFRLPVAKTIIPLPYTFMRFSCVIPVKGKRPFFHEALASLKSQESDCDLEIVIQDGDVEPDSGQSDALNKGFAKARGEWLFWLNADDVLLPGALKKVLDSINNTGKVDWIAGDQLIIDEKGKVLKCSIGNGWHDCLYRHAVPHVYGPSSFFRRELFEKVGGFDTSLHVCMDWDLWIQFMKAGAKFRRISDYLWAQRQWQGSKTQRRITGSELASHRAEIGRMLSKNALSVTGFGIMQMRLWRLLNGNYIREWLDGMKMKGDVYSIKG